MAPGYVEAIRTTYPMFILRVKGGGHQGTYLFQFQFMIMSSRGKFSPFKKSRQLIWKL